MLGGGGREKQVQFESVSVLEVCLFACLFSFVDVCTCTLPLMCCNARQFSRLCVNLRS